jgi:hypothetical protein
MSVEFMHLNPVFTSHFVTVSSSRSVLITILQLPVECLGRVSLLATGCEGELVSWWGMDEVVMSDMG